MIGVFDSGVGGLTVLSMFIKKLPLYDYLYLGDLARSPYGNKSDDVIYKYTKKALDFLFSQGAEIVILACNSASAKALRRIQQEYLPKNYPHKKVLGVIIPLAEEAEKIPSGKKVGIIGTRATISSKTYEKEISKINPSLEVISRATPLLVPFIEEGWLKRREIKMILRYYLRPFKLAKIDYLILGCTHYPLLFPEIKRIIGKKCQILNAPQIVAEKFVNYLERHPRIEQKISRKRRRIFYTTDNKDGFQKIGKYFLGHILNKVKAVDLDLKKPE